MQKGSSIQLLTAARVKAHFERWRALMSPTGQTDHLQAELAVNRLYQRLGLAQPAIFWCQSFYQMLAMPSLVFGILHSDLWELIAGDKTPQAGDKQWNRYWDKNWPEIWLNGGMPLLTGMNQTSRIAHSYGSLEGALTLQVKHELGRALHSGRLQYLQSKLNRDMYRLFWARFQGPQFARDFSFDCKRDVYNELVYIRHHTFEAEGWKTLEALDAELHQRSGGLSDLFALLASRLGAEPAAQERRMMHLPAQIPWLATADLLAELAPERPIREDIQAWMDLSLHCSSVMFLDGLAFLCEKSTAFHTSERQRLHNADGPALAYADGFAEYAWDGTLVPRFVVEDPQSINVETIEACDNAEVRRVMLERYGTARYVEEAHVEPIHSDDYGTLYRKELPGDEPLVMVKVVNSTPEPDGSFKDYFLRVPPTVRTAKEAVAWTFGMESDDYEPSVES